MNKRVIPVLLLKNNGLVKGVNFKNHKYVGDPINAVKVFNEKEVDELVFLDIEASLIGKKPNFDLISNIASQAFMPFAYGGGINKISDIEKLFSLGVEKIILNTTATKNLSFIKEASSIVGAQSIVVSIDVKKSLFGKYVVYSHSGTKNTGLDPLEFSRQVEDAGAGEIILCSIDREGTGLGYDLELINKLSGAVGIPTVVSGGASSIDDFKSAIFAGASAVAAGNIFTFYGKHKAVLIDYPSFDDLENVFNGD